MDNIMKNPMIYEYQKTLFKLTIVLAVGVFWVIRGSTSSLVIDSQILRYLFLSDPNADKTTYNIGISIIAAYLFYLVQVHIPEKKKVERNQSLFSETHRHEIYIINQYIVAWQQFLKEPGVCYFHEFQYTLQNNKKGVVSKEIYLETIKEISDCLERIIRSSAFSDSDVSYKEFIVEARYIIQGWLGYMNDQFPIWSEAILQADDYKKILLMMIQKLKPIQNRLSRIEKYHLKVIEIAPYNGKTETQKLAEKL